jgi:hypothetical protein
LPRHRRALRLLAALVAAIALVSLGAIAKPFGDTPTPRAAASPIFVTTPRGVDPEQAYDVARYYSDGKLVHTTHCPFADPKRRSGDCLDPISGDARHRADSVEISYHGHVVAAGG